jgi:2-keto-4-pentenoate hydratase/2-oxohepta-3-ene-1,7-dioic acid hydratase in catechol pathway
MNYVAGYSIALDMTVRGTEDRSLRKSLDSYAVLGPWLVTPDEIPNPGNLEFSIKVNDELRQHANTRDLIFDIPKLIEYSSSFYTLHPGDIIMTGTPEGVGPVKPGDVMHVEFEEIGKMDVAVRAA